MMKQERIDEIRVQLDDLPDVVGRAYVHQHMVIVLDALEAVQTENGQFRAALSELEQSCRWNTIMHAGQPRYSTSECSVCGVQFDSRVEGKHRDHCPFKVLESATLRRADTLTKRVTV